MKNILRLLFHDDPANRELGALAAQGAGLVEPLYRNLKKNVEDLRQIVRSATFQREAKMECVYQLNDIICNYHNAILELSPLMPKTYISRQRQILTMVKNTTFKYMSMQCRETPKTTELFINQLNGYSLNLGFLFI